MLELRNINKSFGKKNVLIDINLTIPSGKLIGLLGPNGSGKTTLLKLILRYRKPNKGIIMWNDLPLDENSMTEITGFLEGNTFPYWMRIQDARYYYKFYFKDFDNDRFEELIDIFQMDTKQKIIHCSKGNLTKVKLILILSRRAKLYLLDEPLEGLDLISRKKFIEIILDTFNDECTMVVASHFVEEMEQMFTDVIFLKNQRIELFSETEDLRMDKQKSIDQIYMEIFKPCGN